MPVKHITVGDAPRIRFKRCAGSLRIEPGEAGLVEVQADADQEIALEQHEDGILLQGEIAGDLRLRVPASASVAGALSEGDVVAAGIAAFTLDRAEGSVHLEAIGDVVTLGDVEGDLMVARAGSLRAKAVEGSVQLAAVDGAVQLDEVEGDLNIAGAGSVEVRQVEGDLRMVDIRGEALLEHLQGDVLVERSESLRVVGLIEGDVRLSRIGAVTLNDVSGDISATDVQSLSVGAIAGALRAEAIGEICRFRELEGDLRFRQSERATVEGGSIGGDARIEQARTVTLGAVGGDLTVHTIAGSVSIGSVGGNASFIDIGDTFNAGSIGGDLTVRTASVATHIGHIGGDLTLAVHFAPGSAMKLSIGGDARVELPDDASVTLRATVGGTARGPGVAVGSGMFTAIYGEGAASLELFVGGDLALRGPAPKSSSSMGEGWGRFGEHGDHQFDDEVGRWAEQFAEEMGRWAEQFAVEMGRWGEEFGKDMGQRGAEWACRSQRKAEKVRRRVEQRMREAAERAHEAARREGRPRDVRVRINDREWRFDEERLERLKREAAAAAQSGIIGALEAVERALAGLGISRPPVPPVPPSAPPPPEAPSAPPPPEPATGATIRINIEHPETPPLPEPVTGATTRISTGAMSAGEASGGTMPEEERMAILRMVAEGRISPEEADLLLEALNT
ncbi:MAG: hypothetical protein HXY39_18380 [Chloroflexi bacterium]|nr:hypothetical protein [Chloroflexota bacterium]